MLAPGDLLIAPPKIRDTRFEQAVILITQHTSHGTQGICLNRASGTGVNELIEPVGKMVDPDHELYWGGPVFTHTLWMIHESQWQGDNTIRVNSDWSLTSSNTMFARMEASGGPDHPRFALGVSSWAPGQLEMEIEGDDPWDQDSSWIIAQATTPEEMFRLSPHEMWSWACELSAHQTVKHWL
jgi:putative transcriptional regulator